MPPSRRKEAKDRVAARTREGNAARCGAHVSLRGKPRVGFRLIFSHNGIGNELNYLQGYSSRAAVQRRRILAHRSLSLEPRQFCDLPQGLPISLQRHPLTIFHTATCGWLMPLLILHPRWDDGVAERVQRELYPARAPAFQMPLSCAFAGAHAILCLLAGRHSTLSNSRTDPLRAARVVSYSVSLRILSRLLQTAAFSRSVGVRLQLDSQEHALSAARARARTTSRVYGIVRTVARVLEGDIFQRSSVIAPGRLLKARRLSRLPSFPLLVSAPPYLLPRSVQYGRALAAPISRTGSNKAAPLCGFASVRVGVDIILQNLESKATFQASTLTPRAGLLPPRWGK